MTSFEDASTSDSGSNEADRDVSPLTHGSRSTWDRLIAAIHPPSMLVAIRGMMGPRLLQRIEPADLWQEALLMAWRDRHHLEWRGRAAFRRWLLEIARNRVRDLAERETAGKRDVRLELLASDLTVDGASSSAAEHYAGPVATNSPSRVAADGEIAALLQRALDEVPPEWRDVVRLRLFEDRTMEDSGTALGIGEEGARYRFRQGIEVYRRALRRLRAVGSTDAGSR